MINIRFMIQASFGIQDLMGGRARHTETVSVTANDVLLDCLMPDNAPPECSPVQNGPLNVSTAYRPYSGLLLTSGVNRKTHLLPLHADQCGSSLDGVTTPDHKCAHHALCSGRLGHPNCIARRVGSNVLSTTLLLQICRE